MGRYIDLAKEIKADVFCGELARELSELSELRGGGGECELSELRVGTEPVEPETGDAARWGDLAPIVEWFLGSTPPAEPFILKPAVRITNPRRWWRDIATDVAAGPQGPRARYGALQDDLWRIWRMFGPKTEPVSGQ